MTRATRVLLAGWGATAAVVVAVELIRADALGTVGPQWALTYLATYIVGLWVVTVQPANRAALALLCFGCLALTWIAVSAELLVQVKAGTAAGALVLLNAATQAVGYLFVAAEVEAIVRYPHGRRVYAIEGWLVRGLVVLAGVLPVALLVTNADAVPAWILQFSDRSDGLAVPVVGSPWYVAALGWLGPVAVLVNEYLLALGPIAAAVITAARYRRLSDADRRRLAWPLLAVIVLVLGTVLSALADASALPRPLGEGVAIASQLVLPVAMGIGIAAPSLFDALGTARRTLSYLALSALVLGVYVAIAGALGATVSGGDLPVAVAVAVLAALVLDPVRRTLVRRAERLAFGQEVSRDELLLRLGDTLERTLDRAALTRSIAETAMEGLGTQWVRLEVTDAEPVHVGRARANDEPPALSAPLLHGHDDLGTITCGPPATGRPLSRSRIQLETLARQVAMALTNARLADQLHTQLLEVDASRRRLVHAEEIARRRLERDLHDGAQQDIAALLTRIALARNQLGRTDLAPLDDTLTALYNDACDALRNLRELVSGIHEAALADQGLVAAVADRAAKLPIPVDVTVGPGMREGRLSASLESTAYFTVCEALANTLKHGGAQHATITLELDAGALQICVTDDGRGFEPARVNGSSGLTGLRDRIAAVGGTLDVQSAPGKGTALTAVVPAAP